MRLTKRNIPTSLEEARALLGGRDRRRINGNGWLLKRGDFMDFGDEVALKLHATIIVRYKRDGIVVATGGWNTVTTRSWINRALAGSGFGVFVDRGVLSISRWPRFDGDRGPAVCVWYGEPVLLSNDPADVLWRPV